MQLWFKHDELSPNRKRAGATAIAVRNPKKGSSQ